MPVGPEKVVCTLKRGNSVSGEGRLDRIGVDRLTRNEPKSLYPALPCRPVRGPLGDCGRCSQAR